MNEEDKPQNEEAFDAMIAFMYGIFASIGFVAGLAAMWLITRIWR